MLLTATAAAAARLHEGRPAHLRRLLRIRAVQIEADLRFCEDVLHSKLKLVPTTSQSNSRVSSAGDSEPWATRQQHQAQQAQHDRTGTLAEAGVRLLVSAQKIHLYI